LEGPDIERSTLSRCTASISVALLFATTCTALRLRNVTPAVLQNLDARIPTLMEAAEVNGFTIAIVEHRELVWSAAFGQASADLDRLIFSGLDG